MMQVGLADGANRIFLAIFVSILPGIPPPPSVVLVELTCAISRRTYREGS